ncbi:MAG TPA: HIRAN domain-containing protein [Solirubrobacteraceae bacterium]|nr:HIRAN domain-containing protein [Solirubrobacteraceae bacterium]
MSGEQAPPGGTRLGGDPDRGGAGRLRVADVAVEREERYWYPDDGAIVWVAGYTPIDPDSGRFLGRDAPQLAARGLIVAGVAGARFHDDVLQSDALAPGTPLTLRREPGNEHDANAIAVLTAAGAQAGWVPREVAARVAPALDEGRRWAAVVLRERRDSPRAPRHGLTMLLAPAEAIGLRERTADGGAGASLTAELPEWR